MYRGLLAPSAVAALNLLQSSFACGTVQSCPGSRDWHQVNSEANPAEYPECPSSKLGRDELERKDAARGSVDDSWLRWHWTHRKDSGNPDAAAHLVGNQPFM